MFWLQLVAVLVGLATVAALIRSDIRHLVLPDRLNVALGLSGLVFHAAAGWRFADWPELVFGAVAGGALLYGLRLAYVHIRGVEAVGLGDVKFMIAAGLWVGVWGMPMLLAVASLATLMAITGLRLLAMVPAGSLAARRIPFGPGLCLALVLVAADRISGV